MRIYAALAISLFVFFFLTACKKNKDFNPDEVRLTGVDIPSTNGDIAHIVFEYNSAGKISSVRSAMNSDAPAAIFDVLYSGNEIILAKPEQNSSGIVLRDTTRLIIDNNRVQKRIEYSFAEFKAPSNIPQRTFTYDTVIYEYDATGLLKKTVQSRRDTTWFNPGSVQTNTETRHGTETYTNTNRNLTAIDGVIDFSTVSQQNGQTYISKRSTVNTTTFQYTKNSANKMDFSNAAIVNELALFTNAPLNPNYANLPDKQSFTYTEKDDNGTVVSTQTFDASFLFDYNSYGFLKTYELVTPNTKKNLVYNK